MIPTIHPTPRCWCFRWHNMESREFRLYKTCLRAMREFLAKRIDHA